MEVDLLGALLPARISGSGPQMPTAPPAPPAPPAETSWNLQTGLVTVEQNPMLTALYGLAGAVAMGVSYGRNQSVPWALVHGLVGVPYLAYVVWETKVKSEGKPGYAGSYDAIPSSQAMFLEGDGVEELMEEGSASRKRRAKNRR